MSSNLVVYLVSCAVLTALISNSVSGSRATVTDGIVPLSSSSSSKVTAVNRDVEIFHPDANLPHLSERIVGGEVADYTKHPYQLQLAVNGRQLCGASIISIWWAVTAAHCLVDDVGDVAPPSTVTMRAGATFVDFGGRVHNVTKVIVHKSYDDVEYDYDIGLLKVKQPFKYGPTVQRVSLPNPSELIKEGTMATVTGWGLLKAKGKSSSVLKTVALPLISQKKCRIIYKSRHLIITERMVCAGFPKGHRDFCQGDSGGPLVINGKLVGIVSWNIGCGMAGFPGVFTKVSKFRYWIREKSGV